MSCRCSKCGKPTDCGEELCMYHLTEYYQWLAETNADKNLMAGGRFYGESLLNTKDTKDGRTDNRMA